MHQTKTVIYTIFFLWLIVAFLGCLYVVQHHFSIFSVSSVYFYAGLHWMTGQPLYNFLGTEFIYLPQSAIFYVPFSLLPFPVEELVWRCFSILVFSCSLFKFSEWITNSLTTLPAFSSPTLTKYINKNHFVFIIISIVTIPLSITIAQDGQMHLIIMALLFFACISISKEQWWIAAFLLPIAVAIKPTAIIIYLLFTALYPKLWGRIALTTLIMALIPFVAQSPHYALQQYINYATSFSAVSRIQGIHPQNWVQLFSVLEFLFHIKLSGIVQTIIRVVIAVWALGFCYYCKSVMSTKSAIITIFTVGIIYLMLFNPRTENNDYSMLMPFIGYFLALSLTRRRPLASLYLFLLAVMFALNHSLSTFVTPSDNHWLKPILCVFFLGFVVQDVLQDVRAQKHFKNSLMIPEE